jgi:hypothetical protein
MNHDHTLTLFNRDVARRRSLLVTEQPYVIPVQMYYERGQATRLIEQQMRISHAQQRVLFNPSEQGQINNNTIMFKPLPMLVNEEVRFNEQQRYGQAITPQWTIANDVAVPSNAPQHQYIVKMAFAGNHRAMQGQQTKVGTDALTNVPIWTLQGQLDCCVVDPKAPKVLQMDTWSEFTDHRSGWAYAMNALHSICVDASLPIDEVSQNVFTTQVVDVMEKTFSWDLWSRPTSVAPGPCAQDLKSVYFQGQFYCVAPDHMRWYQGQQTCILTPKKRNDVERVVSFNTTLQRWETCPDMDASRLLRLPAPNQPIVTPWIGFWHNPPNMPLWFDYMHSPQSLLQRSIVQESLQSCQGLLVFSRYLADWLRAQPHIPASLPISYVYHPTEAPPPSAMWSWDKFQRNGQKSVIQVGYWLRVLHAIAMVQVPAGWQKQWLYGASHAWDCFQQELAQMTPWMARKVRRQLKDTVKIVHHIDNDKYDDLLSQNVVYLQMYDSSCNNAVLECIRRHTPVIVNRLPAVVEYLGSEYPLYCDTIEDANHVLRQPDKIRQAHEYLKSNKYLSARLEGASFVQSIVDSQVYQTLLASARVASNLSA